MSKTLINIENATIKTAQVEIKTLTIGSKQVTLSVFRQIQEEPLIDFDTMKFNGNPWGTINYFWKDDQNNLDKKLHILWQKGHELRRCIIYKTPSFETSSYETCESPWYSKLLKKLRDIKKDIYGIEQVNYKHLPYCEDQCIHYLEKNFNRLKEWIEKRNGYTAILGISIYSISNPEEFLKEIGNKIDNVKIKLSILKEQLEMEKRLVDIYMNKFNDLIKSISDLPHLFIAI